MVRKDGREVRTLALARNAAKRLGALVPDHLALVSAAEPLDQRRHAVLARQLAKDVGNFVPEQRARVLEALSEGEDRRFRRREVAEREHSAVAGEERDRAVEEGRLEFGD